MEMEPDEQTVRRYMGVGFLTNAIADLEPCSAELKVYLMDVLCYMVSGRGGEGLMDTWEKFPVTYNLLDAQNLIRKMEMLGFVVDGYAEQRMIRLASAVIGMQKKDDLRFLRVLLAIAALAGDKSPCRLNRELAVNVMRKVSRLMFEQVKP